MLTSREQTIDVLRQWIDGSMNEESVWQWALAAQQAGDPQDALVRDIIDNLAALPFDFILVEDAQVMLDALGNPPQETDLSINLLWNHLDMVPTDGRRFELRDHPFYGQFVDGVD